MALDPSIMPPVDPVGAATELAHTGSLPTDGPGRTDNLNISVPGESFVIPADIVSSIGEGNTAHGLKILESMFPPSASKGKPGGVPIVAAGGEFVVAPEYVAKAGNGNVKKGHAELNKFVMKIRNEAIQTLKKLPKPVKG